MTWKRSIACWLTAVYLLMAVGPAYASLSCRCTVMKARTEAIGCHHQGDNRPSTCSCRHISIRTTPEQSAWNAPCCNDRHSTEIALYTNGTDNRTDRIAAPVSAALLPDDVPPTTPVAAFSERVVDRRAHFLCHGTVRSAGLRAPPSQN